MSVRYTNIQNCLKRKQVIVSTLHVYTAAKLIKCITARAKQYASSEVLFPIDYTSFNSM